MQPPFNPAFTPAQMLWLGVFDGTYLNPVRHEYPKSWFLNARVSDVPDKKLNAFGVHSGQSLEEWQRKGWIHPQDPLGWFEWYCRYHRGRRSPDDARQIRRHRAFVRHSTNILHSGGADATKGVVRRQALLQWAYDPFPDFSTLLGESMFSKAKRILLR